MLHKTANKTFSQKIKDLKGFLKVDFVVFRVSSLHQFPMSGSHNIKNVLWDYMLACLHKTANDSKS